MRFSPNGNFVLAGTLDDRLRLWNVSEVTSNSGCSKTYKGHKNSEFCCFSAFDTNNAADPTIVSGSEDGKVHIYGVNDREVRQVLTNHDDAVLAVDVSSKKEFIVTGGMEKDKTVKFWSKS